MKVNFARLNREEQRVLARLKATLALRLAEEAWGADPELRKSCPARGVAMTIGVGGAGPSIRLEVPPSARMSGTPVRHPSLLLFFPGPGAAVRVLSGAKGTAIPLPLRPGALRTLAFFRRASTAATELLRDPRAPDAAKANLLLAATLYGLEAIASERYLARRMQIVPDGSVRVRAEDISYLVIKKGNGIEIRNGAAAATAVLFETSPSVPVTSTQANAELVFSDYRSAIEVLSGKRQAVVALGSGEVRIAGLLPLVQGLFAVLDRLSWYLGVEV